MPLALSRPVPVYKYLSFSPLLTSSSASPSNPRSALSLSPLPLPFFNSRLSPALTLPHSLPPQSLLNLSAFQSCSPSPSLPLPRYTGLPLSLSTPLPPHVTTSMSLALIVFHSRCFSPARCATLDQHEQIDVLQAKGRRICRV